MRRAIMVALAVSLCCACIPASSFGGEMSVDEVCSAAGKTRFPSGDRPVPSSVDSLAGCRSSDLYFGYHSVPDPVKARQCAYLEMDQEDETVLGGSSVLMMIYANGKGVPRNVDVAIRLACGIDAEKAERDELVETLVNLKRGKGKGADFNICDDLMSGYLQEACGNFRKDSDDANRKGKLNELAATWSDQDKKSLDAVVAAFDGFVAARMDNEPDMTETARAALQSEFASTLDEVENGRRPRYSHCDLNRAAQELDAVSQEIERRKQLSWGAASADGMTKTQKAWSKYRDAFAAFGRQRYPEVSLDSWKTWLTRKRIEMLKDILDNDLRRMVGL